MPLSPERQEQMSKLDSLTLELQKLFKDVEGYYVVDNGVSPNALKQARNRLLESYMWAKLWINRDNATE